MTHIFNSSLVDTADHHPLLRESVGKLVGSFGRRYFQEVVRHKQKPVALWNAIASAGYLGVHIAEQYGGGAVNGVLGTFFDRKACDAVIDGGSTDPLRVEACEHMAQKPDFITIYGVNNTAVLTMKALAQFGVKMPAFGITYLGSPAVYQALGAQGSADYNFISCFTPGGSDQSAGNREMAAAADKFGRVGLKEDINYVSGWVTGQMAAESLAKLGNSPSRAKLVESMAKGFTVDSKGLAAPFSYTPDNHNGPTVLKMFGYDHATSKFKHFGDYSDYAKYTK